jgi:hypothetical protein
MRGVGTWHTTGTRHHMAPRPLIDSLQIMGEIGEEGGFLHSTAAQLNTPTGIYGSRRSRTYFLCLPITGPASEGGLIPQKGLLIELQKWSDEARVIPMQYC